jgi:hypothetical protein
MFDKCREFCINLNLKKCMFLAHSCVSLGYVVSKEGKLLESKLFFGYCPHAYPKDTEGHLDFQWHDPILSMFQQGFQFHYGS